MQILKLARRILSPNMKIRIARAFPKLYANYERKFVFSSLGLLQFYDKERNCLDINGAIIDMSQITSPKLVGTFNSEFDDIIQPIAFGSDSILPYNEGPYEHGDVALIEGDVVFDCGANIGLFSAIASSKGCEVYAFEPIPDVVCELEKMALNNTGIKVLPFAISSESRVIDMEYSGISTSTLRKSRMSDSEKIKMIQVKCISLDDFVQENSIRKVSFIKADIEGAERDMLKGAVGVLREFSPKLSICTYHLEDDKEVLERIILEANPKYSIVHAWKKLYAHVPE